MSAAVELLGGNLLQKLTWMKAEGASWPLVRAKLTATADEAEKTSLYDNPGMRDFFVDVCNDEEMAEAVGLLGGTLLQKLTWMKEEGSNRSMEKASMGGTTDAAQKATLYDNAGMLDFFVDVCNDEEMAEAVGLLGGTLLQKLTWMKEEGSNWPLVKSTIVGTTDAAQKTSLYENAGMLDFFVDVCNDEEMAAAVDLLGGKLLQKLTWMKAEGASWPLVRAKLAATADEAEKSSLYDNAGIRDFFVDVCNDEEMAEAVGLLGGTLLQKLTWMKEEGSNWQLVEAKLTATADPGQKTALYDNAGILDFFVDVCNDEEMAAAVDLLGGTLLQKLKWMRAEGSSWSLVKAKLTATADAAEKTGLYDNAEMLDLFVDVCNDEEMAVAVSMLGGTLIKKLQWMVAEGTNAELVYKTIRLADAAELPAVVADKAVMKGLRDALSSDEYKTVEDMLTKGLLWGGTVEHEEASTKMVFHQWLRHTRGEMTVSKGVEFVEKGTFAPGGFDALKRRMLAAVTSYLSRKYKVKIQAPSGPPKVGDGEYPIVVELYEDSSSKTTVNLHGGTHGRGALGESSGNIYELGQAGEASVPDVYLAHECSHLMLGANDEYADAKYPARTVYTDNSLLGDFYKEGTATASIKARHFQYLVAYIAKYFPDRTVSVVP